MPGWPRRRSPGRLRMRVFDRFGSCRSPGSGGARCVDVRWEYAGGSRSGCRDRRPSASTYGFAAYTRHDVAGNRAQRRQRGRGADRPMRAPRPGRIPAPVRQHGAAAPRLPDPDPAPARPGRGCPAGGVRPGVEPRRAVPAGAGFSLGLAGLDRALSRDRPQAQRSAKARGDGVDLDQIATAVRRVRTGLGFGDHAARALDRCIGALQPRQRECIVLAYQGGLSHAEVAAEIAEPLGSVKSWIRRGLTALKRCLES